MDETGTAVFELDRHGHEPSRFENGYVQVDNEDYLAVIDADGNTVIGIPYDDEHELAAYGAGYTVIFMKGSGFDESGYYYIMYDPQGEIILAEKVDGTVSFGPDQIGGGVTRISPSWSELSVDLYDYIRYCGEGVFYIDGSYYFTKSGKVLPRGQFGKLGNDLEFESDEWATAPYTLDSNKTNYGSPDPVTGVLGVNANGDIWTADMPCSTARTLGNGLVVPDFWYAYDIDAGVWTQLDSYYSDRSEMDSYDLLSDGERIAFQLPGKDGSPYFVLFDMQWTELVKPTKGYISKLENGFLRRSTGRMTPAKTVFTMQLVNCSSAQTLDTMETGWSYGTSAHMTRRGNCYLTSMMWMSRA